MGDRSNIQVIHPDGNSIWLYGHWMGEENVSIVEEAFLEGRRIDDPDYFTRILFCKMLKLDAEALDGSTGFGIGTRRADQDHNNEIVVIDYTHTVNGQPEVRREKP